ncbi:hypothetical protein BOTU111921_10605 [Bordetella tumbae]|uniref:hypothetical protein n=1 Tax=Bordetella tumbae TaxID=1649139 RepID=UPI0039F08710
MRRRFKNGCRKFVDFWIGEWIVRLFGYNGGTVIVLRSAFITVWVIFCAIGLIAWIDPMRPGPWSWYGFREQLVNVGPWIGAVFGGVYVALYARFASQWSYLASVYNQIKQVESEGPVNYRAFNEWRAGYIEDALELHLALKPNVAPIVKAWAGVAEVKDAFCANTPGGEARLKALLKAVDAAWSNEEQRRSKESGSGREI